MKNEISFTRFTGGPVETHAYLVTLPDGNLLVDAPEGAADYFRDMPIDLLILTHSHFDHVMDAAKIVREKKCGAAMHRTTEEHLADKMLNKKFGLPIEIEPVKATIYLEESKQQNILGALFDIFEVPGHCPGSICLYNEPANILFGGDVLFAGGVGRWDLPGGDGKLLIAGIRKKLLTLPPETLVLPGHGPETTIGMEAQTNGYLTLKI
ncbi:MAG: MBL fold metallo-hydrolase [Verrucomicrobiae bacterium]|nr:MBL fold metallo-hydrolase [Verrucomicrobiae bacterium]